MKSKSFVTIFFGIIAYMYTATVANYLGYTYPIFKFAEQRAPILIMLVLLGFVYLVYSKKYVISISYYKKTALGLALYMAIRGFQTNNVGAWLSCVVFWALFIIITGNLFFTEDNLQFVSTILCITCIIMSILFVTASENAWYVSSVAGSNSIYYILGLVPWVFLQRSKYLKFISSTSIVLAIFFSQKGTCILALIVLCAYVLYESRILIIRNYKKIFSIILGLFLFTVTIEIIFKKVNPSININDIISGVITEINEGGNGRSSIYLALIHEYFDSSILAMIFGHGYAAASRTLGIGTHNDFLLTLYDYGLIGFTLYLAFWLSLLRKRKHISGLSTQRSAYNCSLIVFFFVSMFSNIINSQIQFILLCTFWGCMSSVNSKIMEV